MGQELERVSPGRDHSSVACWEVDSIAEAIRRSQRHCHRRHHLSSGCPHISRQICPSVETAAAPFTSVHTHGMCHVLEALTDNDERATILSVDGMGAFDLISRESMMRGLLEVEGGGKVLPFVRQFYGFFFNTSVGRRRGNRALHPKTQWLGEARGRRSEAVVWRENRTLPPCEQGVMVFGTPVGHWDFFKGKLEALSTEHQSLLEKTQHIGDLQPACCCCSAPRHERTTHFGECTRMHSRLQFAMTSL